MAWQYVALAAYQLYNGAQQANAIQRQAELSQKLNQLNIENAEYDAYLAEQDGYSQQARYQNVIEEVDARARVQYISAGVDPNFGTAKELQEQNKVVAGLNLLDIQSQAHKRALGFKQEALNRKGQGALNMLGASAQADATRTTSYINAANTGLTGYERYKTNTPTQKPTTGGGHFGGTAMNWSDEESYNIQYGGGLGRIG